MQFFESEKKKISLKDSRCKKDRFGKQFRLHLPQAQRKFTVNTRVKTVTQSCKHYDPLSENFAY